MDRVSVLTRDTDPTAGMYVKTHVPPKHTLQAAQHAAAAAALEYAKQLSTQNISTTKGSWRGVGERFFSAADES